MRSRAMRRPLAVYFALEGALALFMGIYGTVTTIYRVQTAGLDPLQLTLVGTALEGSVFLLQLPTGALADTFSRRASVIVGVFLPGAGFLLEGLFPVFWTILLAQVLWGSGYCFINGAEEAWISDEIGVERANQAFLRASQVWMAAQMVGVAISVALASVRLSLPLVTAGALTLALGLALIPLMPESRPASREEDSEDGAVSLRERLAAVGRTARAGLALTRARPVLLLILAITLFQGMSSEGFDRLGEAHFLVDTGLPSLGPLQPVVWFGVFSVAIMLVGLGASEVARRRVNTNSHTAVSRALLGLVAALLVCLVAFALAPGFAVAAVAYVAANAIRRVTGPLATAWMNQSADARSRATVLSLEGQADALGQIAGGPVVGAIGLAVSLPAALLASAAALLPALALYLRALTRREEVVVAAGAVDGVDAVDEVEEAPVGE